MRTCPTYPRDMAGDLAKLEAEGVDYVFTPEVAEIYRPGANTIVDNPVLSRDTDWQDPARAFSWRNNRRHQIV